MEFCFQFYAKENFVDNFIDYINNYFQLGEYNCWKGKLATGATGFNTGIVKIDATGFKTATSEC